MIKKSLAMFAIASLALTASCKKENAALRIDDATAQKAEMAHAESGKLPKISFDEKEFDFGALQQGDKAKHTYTFTNTGEGNLIISNAKASCGCTVPSYSQEPIAPGKKGEVTVEFNTAGKSGHQSKTVTLTLNTEEGSEVLNFTADVKAKDNGIGVKGL